MQPPALTNLEFRVDEIHQTVVSWKVLKAAPALQTIAIEGPKRTQIRVGVMKYVIMALRHGALLNLQKLDLRIYEPLEEEEDVTNLPADFADALEYSFCAKRLVSLRFRNCNLSAEGLRALAGPLRRGAFPALEELYFSGNRDMRDEGVVALAEAMLNAAQTSLRSLDMGNVGTRDAGYATLASVVQQCRFDELYELGISENGGITDKGMTALARAIDTRGLPMLDTFDMQDLAWTVGVRTIVDALSQR